MRFFLIALMVAFFLAPRAGAAAGYDAGLSGYAYPFPVRFHAMQAQGQALQMAYMDIAGKDADAPVIVLLHGKNFGGYVFEDMAKMLAERNYRVIIPDQIGFGKSSKPGEFQYSFQALAAMTQDLLTSLGVHRYKLLGHSMGGMLATRMALDYPDAVEQLILVNPIGLEDWKRIAPYQSIDDAYAAELAKTPESIRKYQADNYFDGKWKDSYDALIEPALGWLENKDYPLVAINAARTSDMIFTQPVLYEFSDIKVPTALIIGQRDRTAIGRERAPKALRAAMGDYPALGRAAQRRIPGARLFEIEGLGHLPFIENPQAFAHALDRALR